MKQVKQQLTYLPSKKLVAAADMVSCGTVMLNLALTGKTAGAFPKGFYTLLVGDTDSCKTFLCLATFAEAMLKPAFKDYRLIYDDNENGIQLDVPQFFGQAVADRMEIVRSRYVENFYRRIDAELAKKKPFIYVLDSENALNSKAAEKKAASNKARADAGEDEKGSFVSRGTAKAHSENLLRVTNGLEETGSILIIICQTRDRIGFGAQYDPKTRAGGRALAFFAQMQIWTEVRTNIVKQVLGQKRQIGIIVRAKVKRSRVTGRKKTIEFPIYWSHGIDNTGSMVDYLIEEGVWSVNGDREATNEGKTVTAGDFNKVLKRAKLIEWIESSPAREKKLRDLVRGRWNKVDEACAVKRKFRYA